MTLRCPTNLIAGVLVRSLLWHLLEEGTCTVLQLAKLTGRAHSNVDNTLQILCMHKRAQRLQSPPAGALPLVRRGRVPAVYGLTQLGIDEALLLDRASVLFAEQPANTQREEAAS